MNYTKGEWIASHGLDRNQEEVHLVMLKNDFKTGPTIPVAEICTADDANLIVAVVNACQKINPDNPQAAAEVIGDMYEALSLANDLIIVARLYFPKSMHNPHKFQLENTCATINNALAKVEGK